LKLKGKFNQFYHFDSVNDGDESEEGSDQEIKEIEVDAAQITTDRSKSGESDGDQPQFRFQVRLFHSRTKF
jgi:hypothetical protein